MLEEISRFANLAVYTNQGLKLGTVENLVLDIANNKIEGLFVTDTNPTLVEGSVNVNIPYRWVQAVGDVIILKYFPSKVTLKKEEKEKGEETSETK
ncbi:MAG: PRC-barrel domain-containing protein [Candidatus Thermoplasmatota archaeon]|nr:PRC-barrel domain-containing protein [Candidatus Thermoplasmatota archaeon]